MTRDNGQVQFNDLAAAFRMAFPWAGTRWSSGGLAVTLELDRIAKARIRLIADALNGLRVTIMTTLPGQGTVVRKSVEAVLPTMRGHWNLFTAQSWNVVASAAVAVKESDWATKEFFRVVIAPDGNPTIADNTITVMRIPTSGEWAPILRASLWPVNADKDDPDDWLFPGDPFPPDSRRTAASLSRTPRDWIDPAPLTRRALQEVAR